MLTSVLPGSVSAGGELATAAFLGALRENGHQVTVVGYSRAGSETIDSDDTVVAGDRIVETATARWSRVAWMARSAVRRRPYSVAKFESRAYARRTADVLATRDPDLVIIEHAQMTWVQQALRWHQPTVLNTQNVENQMYQRLASLKAGTMAAIALRREARLMERWERSSAALATEIWALTDDDARYFRVVAAGRRVRQFDLPVTLDLAPAGEPCDIGILGTWTWGPNRAGLEWFLDTVVPLLPLNLEIRVAGRGGEWIKRRSPKVRWAGVVPSAGAFLRSARVIAVPSVTGGGVQVKALDAISAGRPVVATSTALRGIHDLPGYVVCVDDPAQFAASLSESVSGVTTGDAVIEGQAWASQRRERFVLAVNAAVLALAAES